jgi:hypothetical protein
MSRRERGRETYELLVRAEAAPVAEVVAAMVVPEL